MDTEVISRIPLDRLQESTTNPRRTYNQAALEELAESIKVDGVIEPILVRPLPTAPLLPDDKRDDLFEIVFGHRRFRGSQLAGVPDIPCMVRALADADVARLQMVENLKREDVNAVEEADGYAALMTEHGYTVEQLMELSGKGRSHVYGRLTLSRLCPGARQMVVDGVIGAEAALEVAKIPGYELQGKFLAKLKDDHIELAEGGKNTFDRARSVRLNYFSLKLKDAIFDTEDAELVAGAPACTTCPQRSGNTPELYADVIDGKASYFAKGEHICMNVDCFGEKKAAHLAREAGKLQEAGAVVVTGQKALRAIDQHGKVKSGFIPAKDVKASELKAAGDKVQVLTILDPRDGKTHKVIERSAAKAAGVKVAAEAPKRTTGVDWKAEQQKREQRGVERTAQNMRLFRAVRAAQAEVCSAFEIRTLAREAIEWVNNSEDEEPLAKLWGEPLEAMVARLDTLTVDQALRVMLDCHLASDLHDGGWDSKHRPPPHLVELAEHYGIDVQAAMVVQAPGQAAPTPSAAARAPKGAKASGAKKAAPARKTAKARASIPGICRSCGCTDEAACPEGCSWVEPDLCSACHEKQTDNAGSAGGSDAQGVLPVDEEQPA